MLKHFVLPLVLLLALPTTHSLEFVKVDELASMMANEEQQIVLGHSTRGQCGEPCEIFKKFLTELEVTMNGYFKVVLADITTMIKVNDEENTLQNLYNITQIPGLQIFPYGHKSYHQAYAIDTNTTGQLMGGYLNAPPKQKAAYHKQVHDVFLQFLPKGEVEQVNAGNAEDWFKQDKAKGRVLLVTSKKTTPPMFTKLALDFDKGMKFGELRSSQSASLDKLKELGIEVTEFPKVLIGKPGKKVKMYTGKLGLTAIAEELAKVSPGVVVPELLSNSAFQAECTNKGGICVVALLSSRFDAPLETFKKVAARRFTTKTSSTSSPVVNFVWVNADRQEDFMDAFDVESLPTVIAMNPRKKFFSMMKGSFEQTEIQGFVSRTLDGKEPLSKIAAVPKLEKIGPSMSMGKMDAMMRGDL
jgi:hypothetical protein